MLNANNKKYSSLVFYVYFMLMHFTPQLLRHYSRGHVYMFVYWFICMFKTHSPSVHGPYPHSHPNRCHDTSLRTRTTHTLSQSVLNKRLTQLWAAPEDMSVSVRGAEGARIVFTQQSSWEDEFVRDAVVQFVLFSRSDSQRLLFAGSSAGYGTLSRRDTAACRPGVIMHYQGCQVFSTKPAQLLLWEVKYTFFWHGSIG